MATVSVVIPCFNQGAYLVEAIESVLAQSWKDLEIVVVNDGSTDPETVRVCSTLNTPKTSVLTTDNQGLAAARNNGIRRAVGRYILPLDADDRIDGPYLEEAVNVLERQANVGIVYCRARLFGAVETDWLLPPFSMEAMLKDNVIFCSALFRKSDWELAGGYDTGMIYGWEDYDFWLSLLERGREVRRLEGRYFCYRVSPDSMVRSKEKWQKIAMFKRIYERHRDFIGSHIEVWLEAVIEATDQYLTSRLYVDCGNGARDDDSMARKIEPGERLLVFDITGFTGRRALRFDPVDRPAVLEVCGIELEHGGRVQTVETERLQANALYRENKRFFFATSDPQIILPVEADQVRRVGKVTVRIDIRHVGEAALQEIIRYQGNLLAKPQKTRMLSRWLAGNFRP